jgi:uncharacterized membrane protein
MSVIINWIVTFPPDLATALMAMIPILELRAAIPFGIEVFGLSPVEALIMSYLGNAVPAFIVLFGLEAIAKWSNKHVKWCNRCITRFMKRTERTFHGKYKRYGALALFIFTAIPLPVTGVWTASVAAVVFRIKWKYSLPAILLGMVAAGVIVTLVTLFAGGMVRNIIL